MLFRFQNMHFSKRDERCIRKLGLSDSRVSVRRVPVSPLPFHRMPRGSCRDFMDTKAAFAVRMVEALIPWRTVSGAAIIRAILHVASNTARILFIGPWLLICQITHIHEKDALVSATWGRANGWKAPVPMECTACHARRRG